MSDEAKLGLIAGVLAVVGVAAFGLPKDPATAKPEIQPTTNLPPMTAPATSLHSNRMINGPVR